MPSSDKSKQKPKIKGSETTGEKRGSTAKAAMSRALGAMTAGGARPASSSKGPAQPGGAAKAARSAASSSSSARKGLRARKAGDR